MLKGIHPAISPDLLAVLSRMGHGDEILFADAHFPAETFGSHVVLRADGVNIDTLLAGTLPLFELDAYCESPLVMMQAVEGDQLDPTVESKYMAAITKTTVNKPALEQMDRFDFYDRAEKCFAIVLTGETAKYGNIILKKGVTPV
ncbi:L-fucose mutarotase [Vibrio sp. E150_011]